ncbi:MAG: type IV pilus modification PilV family protein [Desulfomonilia bacterium]
MKNGFTLIEVMVALIVIMIFSLALFQMFTICVRSSTYAECQTYATVLGSEKILWLEGVSMDDPDLDPAWHQDPGNPVVQGDHEFFRFWSVRDVAGGKEVTIWVAWGEGQRAQPVDFASYEDMLASRCPSMEFSSMIFNE